MEALNVESKLLDILWGLSPFMTGAVPAVLMVFFVSFADSANEGVAISGSKPGGGFTVDVPKLGVEGESIVDVPKEGVGGGSVLDPMEAKEGVAR